MVAWRKKEQKRQGKVLHSSRVLLVMWTPHEMMMVVGIDIELKFTFRPLSLKYCLEHDTFYTYKPDEYLSLLTNRLILTLDLIISGRQKRPFPDLFLSGMCKVDFCGVTF